ncbi:alpha-L-fucosidase [bacterium]|nr:alpha-L-fucosidase [bacterium]
MKRTAILSLTAIFFLACAALGYAADPYQPNWDSLDSRPIPSWYQDAKLGIFIHWGVYAVPSYAPKGQYAEWYWRRMGGPPKGTPKDERKGDTWEFHKRVYGEDFEYHQFAPRFKAELFDPAEWADIFHAAGAKYVCLTSKHHDGYCLFQSEEANRSWGRAWNSVDVGPERDLLGELGDAVREAGLKMGFYYSLYEWFNPLWLTDRDVYIEKHMIPQFKDVVTRYKPAIIFSDGEWDLPAERWHSKELLAWLFNESPCREYVVVNDRWGKGIRHNHGDYYTTEYGSGMADDAHPWEENRGMGHSYGFNSNEPLDQYRTSRELVLMFIDLVSRGGNLLLNVGPTADGRIPVIMEERLRDMGKWLDVNGEAIYGTHPWKRTRQWTEGKRPDVEYGGEYKVKYDINDVTQKNNEGKAIVAAFLTQKEDTVYAICPNWPGDELRIDEIKISPNTKITMLGLEGTLACKKIDGGIVIEIPELDPGDTPCDYAYTVKITNTK